MQRKICTDSHTSISFWTNDYCLYSKGVESVGMTGCYAQDINLGYYRTQYYWEHELKSGGRHDHTYRPMCACLSPCATKAYQKVLSSTWKFAKSTRAANWVNLRVTIKACSKTQVASLVALRKAHIIAIDVTRSRTLTPKPHLLGAEWLHKNHIH